MKKLLIILTLISTSARAQAKDNVNIIFENKLNDVCLDIVGLNQHDDYMLELEEDGINTKGLQDICNEWNNYFI